MTWMEAFLVWFGHLDPIAQSLFLLLVVGVEFACGGVAGHLIARADYEYIRRSNARKPEGEEGGLSRG